MRLRTAAAPSRIVVIDADTTVRLTIQVIQTGSYLLPCSSIECVAYGVLSVEHLDWTRRRSGMGNGDNKNQECVSV